MSKSFDTSFTIFQILLHRNRAFAKGPRISFGIDLGGELLLAAGRGCRDQRG